MALKMRAAKGKDEQDEDDNGSESSQGHSAQMDEDEEVVPKYAQYIDSDEDEDSDEEEESNSEEEIEPPEDEEMLLRKRMESIPFSSLVRAQKSIKVVGSDEESDSEVDEFKAERIESADKRTKKNRSMYDLQKRENKHAPTELSSRKPVSRKRTVVETQNNNILRRDPRFSSLSASQPNLGLFQSSYGFLQKQQSSEVKELKVMFNKLKRQEANQAGPKAKSELALSIQKERQTVEEALKRAEGRENERRVREREKSVIRKEKKAIEDRVKQGGKPFHLKESAKKQLILKDKFDRLSGVKEDKDNESGIARKDLKRAIERRRKKNAAKERQSMPLGGGSSSQSGVNSIPKRKKLASSSSGSEERKRSRYV